MFVLAAHCLFIHSEYLLIRHTLLSSYLNTLYTFIYELRAPRPLPHSLRINAEKQKNIPWILLYYYCSRGRFACNKFHSWIYSGVICKAACNCQFLSFRRKSPVFILKVAATISHFRFFFVLKCVSKKWSIQFMHWLSNIFGFDLWIMNKNLNPAKIDSLLHNRANESSVFIFQHMFSINAILKVRVKKINK